ncbi:DUF3237 family protein [Companilactobacillus paralimentarius]|jgi:Protein of unknown function (DUF3237).|nr:DUF3237 family protein [Companilactobacillus paralimentarius]KAE9563041.1 hypothetical protein ATN96_11460 [Companilactobacillus paralimentarius]MDR4933426.1 DUF3237 family protein [Companilactobacillus paralimentarius]QFR69913.1 DUF3237 family protein [Companilactobacillus paralimentarius]
MALKIKSFIDIHIMLGNPIRIGNTKKGYFKIIPIDGGYFTGEISGKVLKFGGDFNYKFDDKYSSADASYVLQTENNQENIFIRNSGNIEKGRIGICHPEFIVNDEGYYGNLANRTFISKIIPDSKNKFGNIIIKIYEIL